jgi:CubicO group peptidase (beta-lactamase class C family)
MRTQRAAYCLALLALAACSPGDVGAEVDGESAPYAAAEAPAPAHVLDVRPSTAPSVGLDSATLRAAFARAAELPRLRCLVVGRHGEVVAERCFRGPGLAAAANVKSVSKSIVSALVGVAIAEGKLEGPAQPIAPFFARYLGSAPDERKGRITIGHLLSMQSGLERTSGENYGRWVTSPDWVRFAIGRPMVDEPGGRMLYSTGNTHLLSAILTRATGESTWAFARARLAEPLGIQLPRWPTDPQGIYFGGNEMRLTPRAMFRFGELYRNQGRWEGRQVVPAGWVRESLTPRTRSPWSGEAYGYGWFLGDAGGHPMFFAWGYGGQFVFVVPDLELTVVTTSDPESPREQGHLRAVHALLDEWIVRAAELGGAPGGG